MGNKTRSKTKQKEIFLAVRDKILHGEIKPGERLPNRLWFEQHYNASSATIQSSFAALAQAGFVVSSGRNGTYVSQRPPHLNNYGLVFATAPGQPDWSNFHKSLLNETEAIKIGGNKSITCYFNIGEKLNGDSLSRLLKDVSEHQLAGLIMISRACFRGTPLLELTEIPRVVLKGQPFDPNIPVITFGGLQGFARPAIEHLRSRGRKRLAFVLVTNMDPVREPEIQELLTEYGLPFYPYSVQCVYPAESRWAANLAHLFARLPADERPDGIVIADDNLVEHFCAGLVAAGIRFPKDMDIVAHCNFPCFVPSILPVVRLGYNLRSILFTAIGLIDQLKSGVRVKNHLVIKPVFEKELAGIEGETASVFF